MLPLGGYSMKVYLNMLIPWALCKNLRYSRNPTSAFSLCRKARAFIFVSCVQHYSTIADSVKGAKRAEYWWEPVIGESCVVSRIFKRAKTVMLNSTDSQQSSLTQKRDNFFLYGFSAIYFPFFSLWTVTEPSTCMTELFVFAIDIAPPLCPKVNCQPSAIGHECCFWMRAIVDCLTILCYHRLHCCLLRFE